MTEYITMLHRASSSKITRFAQIVDEEPSSKRKRAIDSTPSGGASAEGGGVTRIDDAVISPKGIELLNPLPKDYFPSYSRDPDTTFNIIEEELLLDGNAKQNLATFCQTWENDISKKIMELGEKEKI